MFAIQSETGYRFDINEVIEIARNTIKKGDLNGKNESYVPVLLKNELEDFVMRKRINFWRRVNR